MGAGNNCINTRLQQLIEK